MLSPVYSSKFPFRWYNMDYIYKSNAIFILISYKSDIIGSTEIWNVINRVIEYCNEVPIIYSDYWWYECLDVVDANNLVYDFNKESISIQTRKYLKTLELSNIDIEYKGLCHCSNLNQFTDILYQCVVTHVMPYCPKYVFQDNEIVLYFHHTDTFGVYMDELDESSIDFYNYMSSFGDIELEAEYIRDRE